MTQVTHLTGREYFAQRKAEREKSHSALCIPSFWPSIQKASQMIVDRIKR